MAATSLLMLALLLARAPAPSPRTRVVEIARGYLHQGRIGGDCSGFVLTVYREAGLTLQPAVATRSRSEAIYRAGVRVRTPRPGDVAVFHNTYDRDRDGRADDLFTHVGIVEAVHGSEVSIIHLASTGVERIELNLKHRGSARENSVLRQHSAHDAPRTKYLAGQLLAGFTSPLSRPQRSARAAQVTSRIGGK